jgi:hypothetical protein
VIEHADHSFHVLKRSGRTDEQVLDKSWPSPVAEWTSGRPAHRASYECSVHPWTAQCRLDRM